MSAPFVPSLELNHGFYREVVAPLVAPWPHAAALVGFGSDVLGFDSMRSTDHGWGPRLHVFVAPDHVDAARAAVGAGLPSEYAGWPVRFALDEEPVTHHVHVDDLDAWLHEWLGHNPRPGMTAIDWLTLPQQLLLGVVRGAVYHDGPGVLTAVREQLAYFPHDVRMWLLACQWRRIDQEEPFAGRAAEAGDDLGARIIVARQVRELMRLHFLLEGVYWPYAKWFGTAYRSLPGSAELLSAYGAALNAPDAASREDAMVAAYEMLARRHNDAGLTTAVDPHVRPFHNRPFRVLRSDRFVRACVAEVHDDTLRALPLVGSVDQCVDSTDVLAYPHVVQRLRALYGV